MTASKHMILPAPAVPLGGSGFHTAPTMHGSSPASINASILKLSVLAAVAFERLELITSSRFAGEALNIALANGMDETIAAGCAATVLAHVQYELGDLDRAEHQILGHLSTIRFLGAADVVIRAYAILSRIAQHRARFEHASSVLDEGKAVGERRSCSRLALTMMAERVRMWISQREIGRAREEFATMQRYRSALRLPAPHAGDEIRHVCNLTRWRLALAEGRAADAVSPLRALCNSARLAQRRYTAFVVTLELLGALDSSGDHEAAEHLLRRALQRSERYGLFQSWIDAGCANAALSRVAERCARELSPQTMAPNPYLVSLLSHADLRDSVRQRTRRTKRRETDRLSARECAVLALIAKGQSNKHIARSLQITPETVKSHLKRAFLKLGSKTRAEAVARATELGWGCTGVRSVV